MAACSSSPGGEAKSGGGDSLLEDESPVSPGISDNGVEVHWGYGDTDGPSAWGELSPDYATCAQGEQQSPINIRTSLTSDSIKSLSTNYRESGVTVLNNGHTIQVNYDAGSIAHFDGQEYELLQFHFHTPSEHKVNNKALLMEMHLVHKNAEEGLGVISILFEEGGENPFLSKFWSPLPRKVGEVPSNLKINISEVFPGDPHFYYYDGSLTTPPCSEGVKWFVMKETVLVSRDQADKFLSIFGENARPVQPLNERFVEDF